MSGVEKKSHDFLSGGGEMGQLIRDFDWESSPLGCPASWSQSLKTIVRLLLTSGHPMFIWWGPELLQFYNDAYRRSIGSERHPSALGQRGRECWTEIWDIIGPQIEQVMAGGGGTWHENQLVPITRNGKREDVYWTYSYNPIDDPNAPHGIGGVLVVCAETTAQVLAEQRKKAQEARWRELFTQAPGFMCILNGPNHTFEFANPRYNDLVGNRKIIGKTVRETIPEASGQGFIELLDQVYRSGEAYIGIATPISLIQPPDNVLRHYNIDFVYQPICDADGNVTGIFVDGFDVTEQVRTSQILRENDRRKDEFIAMLAHEHRNPLAPIRNASELLIRSSETESSERSMGELIKRQVTQLTNLVDDLLDVSRITQGNIELQKAPLILGNLIKQAIESVQPLINAKQHQLIYQDKEDGLYINGDPTRIVQCITNVLNNAAKYTDNAGTITIRLREVNGYAVVDITDNGMGIAPEVLPNVFDLFVQADRTPDRSHGGLGIGLSIVHRLLQMHNASIRAESPGLDQGSTFQLSFPLIDPPLTAVNKTVDSTLTSMRLLIVDDNVDAANTLAQLLSFKGHETTAVYNAHEALSLVKTFAADVVLLDIGLPDIDGYEVARRIRSEGSESILIALTGYGQPEDIRAAEAAGFNSHITKPVTLANLESVLAEYC